MVQLVATMEAPSCSIHEFQSREINPEGSDEALLYTLIEGKETFAIVYKSIDVGMIQFNNTYDSWHISVIYILKEFRGRGIGSSIIEIMKSRYRGTGMKMTACPFTSESEDFFLKHGFEPESGDIDEYYYLYFKA